MSTSSSPMRIPSALSISSKALAFVVACLLSTMVVKSAFGLKAHPTSSSVAFAIQDGSAMHDATGDRPLKRESHAIGPITFRLARHQQRSFLFTVPDVQGVMLLKTALSATGGEGGHLNVQVFHNLHRIYDSGDSAEAVFSIELHPGEYSMVITNTAALFPRDITLASRLVTLR